MSKETEEKSLSTADLAAGARAPETEARARPRGEPLYEDRQSASTTDATSQADAMTQVDAMPQAAVMPAGPTHAEQLAALFPADVAGDFRSRWDAVQIGFVDDPRQAVQKADELVAQVMKSLAESFARQRSSIEADVGKDEQASTENLRMALRSYRSFFQRLLSL